MTSNDHDDLNEEPLGDFPVALATGLAQHSAAWSRAF
jgi:hypothetical protein